MKFDCIIGNPPYQEESKDTSDKPIYNMFMDEAYKTGDKVMLITPARFLFNAGSTPKDWNKKMLEDEHLKVLKFVLDSSKVFANTDIKGGVAITYRSARENFGAIGVYTAFEELNVILQKVVAKRGESITTIIYATESYKFTQVMHDDFPQIESMLSKGHKYDFKTTVLEKLCNIVFFQNKPNDNDEYVQILGLVKSKRETYWIKRRYIKAVPNFEHYKIFVPAANGSGSIGEVLSTPLIGRPLSGHTQTFISIGAFETEQEAENCLKYVKTKFARTMLGVLKITQHNPRSTWRYVPLQDFTPSSDIDWGRTVAEIDRQLYEKYGLSEGEVAFIEEKVRAME